ncbi:hypothetical protein S40285_03198 [Stachybotrys chlorohalonatus IBT 40285]|uniref:NAD dependent epimerase/dehydratase n=1 Tax=Stachybotrys chlorohalonatus (strain IBT 40285) TaxID=1283841 RepID=A0A084QI49_STAC4|nr:hypothetical protein S40285_03198 [Stachybotrys chlorohalonata IBT 40285]
MGTSTFSPSDRVVPMKVIVCGLQRTGTMSMRHALWQLGFHDCYHMHSLVDKPARDAPQWVRALEAKYAGKGSFDRQDWDRLLGDCQGVCDLPPALFGPELAECYPDAKVIILNRDPEAWYESVLKSIYAMIHPSSPLVGLRRLYCFLLDEQTRCMAQYVKALTTYALTYDHGKEKEKAIAWYKDSYQEFRDRIPEHRRFEYAVGDGWGPLCEYLEVPIPQVKDEATGELVEAPFPRLNDRSSFQAITTSMWAKGTTRANDNLLKLAGKASLLGVVGYAGYFGYKMLLGRRV